ncbi:MAG TPA: hypothetical protein PKA51_08605, partial [Kiritimatiellia bacterium]|nr:hypothetical protein [Kiritimatiellia bacterium]
ADLGCRRVQSNSPGTHRAHVRKAAHGHAGCSHPEDLRTLFPFAAEDGGAAKEKSVFVQWLEKCR